MRVWYFSLFLVAASLSRVSKHTVSSSRQIVFLVSSHQTMSGRMPVERMGDGNL